MAWIAALVAVLAALIATGRVQIHSDLMALLPAPDRDPVKTAALDRLAGLGQRRVVVLIGVADDATGNRAADAAAAALADSPAFMQVIANADDLLTGAQRNTVQTLLFEHRFHLLAPDDAAALDHLTHGDGGALAHFMDGARARLYGLGVGGTGRFADDPLGLAAAYRNSATASPAPALRVSADGHLVVSGGRAGRYTVVFAEGRHDPFKVSAQSGQLQALAKARKAAHAVAPRAEILTTGVVRHAAAATNRARGEVTLIGSGSLIGIAVLMLWAFGGIRPLLLSVMAIAGGVLLAVIVTASVFGSIHVLTLVFGASLVGVSIDYCLHFFVERWHTPQPRSALRRILPAVTLGLTTSVLAYGGMGLAPFPGLRQIALFAATGLIGAWLGVVFLLPGWAGRPPRSGAALELARRWLAHGPSRLAGGHERAWLWGMTVLCVLLALVAVTQLSPADNIRILYDPPPDLLHEDMQVTQLLGTSQAGRSILVRGGSRDDVLQTEAAMVHAIEKPATPVAEVQAVTGGYPPPAEQRRYYRQLANTLYADNGPVAKLLAEAGFKPASVQVKLQDFADARGRILTFQNWLDSPVSTGVRDLWLGRIGNEWASVIRVRQVNDASALDRIVAAERNAEMIDRVAEISKLLGHFRYQATWLLGGAYVLAALLLWWPFGVRGVWAILMPPMLASVLVAVVFAATGWPFSLFNLLAMILLLGLGADYGIFLRMARGDQAPAMLAVGLSAVTTLLAFGLLALSATPALHGFGLTLAIGLTMTVVLASVLGGHDDARPVLKRG